MDLSQLLGSMIGGGLIDKLMPPVFQTGQPDQAVADPFYPGQAKPSDNILMGSTPGFNPTPSLVANKPSVGMGGAPAKAGGMSPYGLYAALGALGQQMQPRPKGTQAGTLANMFTTMGAYGQGAMQGDKFGLDRRLAEARIEALKQRTGQMAAGPEQPSNVREWLYYQSLSPDEKKQYLIMKRANPFMNLGDRMMQPNPVDPTQPNATFKKGLPPQEEPALQGEQSRQRAIGQGLGKREIEAPAEAAATQIRTGPFDRLSKTVEEVLASPALDDIVGLKSMVPIIPGTPRADAMAKLDNLKSQVAQTVLLMYRQMSQTGGAVGQVSNFEQQMFQNNLAALDRAQTPKEFRRQMEKIKEFVRGSKARIKAAYKMQFGKELPEDENAPAPEKPRPTVDELLNKYGGGGG